MTKLAMTACALLALTGCPSKQDEPKKTEPTVKVVEPKPGDEAAKPPSDEAAKPPGDEAAKPNEAAKPAVFPAECTEYKDAVAKAATCEKLATRDDLKKKLEESWAKWEKLDDAGRSAAAAECKTAAASVKEATTKACP